MKKYILVLTLIALVLIPATAFAVDFGASAVGSGDIRGSATGGVGAAGGSGCQTPQDLGGLFTYSLCLLTYYVTPFLFALAGVVFIIGVVNYVRAGDNEEKRAQGRDLMWFGIIALFVMISIWGFVNILSRSIFGRDSQLPNLPRQATSVFQQ